MYHTLIIVSAIMFSFQFFCSKRYQKNEGNSFRHSLLFSAYTSFAGGLLMLLINGEIAFSWFSFAVAAAAALVLVFTSYCSIKALSAVDMATYSLFTMSGGMLLPFLFGILVYHETLTWQKAVCLACIGIAILLVTGRWSHKHGSLKWCIGMFTLNGMVGVIAKLHQSYPKLAVSSAAYSALMLFLTVLISVGWLVVISMRQKQGITFSMKLKKPSWSLIFMGSYAALNSFANWFLLEALAHGVDASLQYPMVTGGVMVLSAVISFLSGERPTTRTVSAVVLSVAALLLLVPF